MPTDKKFKPGDVDENGVIQQLLTLGYFADSTVPKSGEPVTSANLSKLRLTDDVVRDQIERYREMMLSPETSVAELFAIERCGCPDYGGEMATGRGSWPSGCHSEYPDNHSFAVYFEYGSMPAFWRDVFDGAWLLVRQAYADIGIAFFETKDRSKANTVVSWTRGAGWIGLAIVPNGPRCGEQIWAKFDNRYSPSNLMNQIAALMLHEFCHNMGLSHTRGGIMNPSITQVIITPTAWRGDTSERPLVQFFGGEPVRLHDLDPPEPPDTPDPPTPPKPPGPNEFWFRGSFELMQGDKAIDEFILTPKPKV